MKKIISFPHMGNYHTPITVLMKRIFPNYEVRPAPATTAHTLELGSKHSPDFVCSPFKTTLGNYIEAHEAGANVLIQSGTGCRYGYYGEVQEQILRDLGYDFTFLCFARERARPDRIFKTLRTLDPGLRAWTCIRALAAALYKIYLMDKFLFFLRENGAFEAEKGAFEALKNELYAGFSGKRSFVSLRRLKRDIMAKAHAVPLKKPERPLRVGIVGDLYTLMEPGGNYFIENELMESGVSVSREMSLTFLAKKSKRLSLFLARNYLKYDAGANGTDSVRLSERYARRGYDGVIHMKSFGCTPEINVIPALQRISADYSMPILHLSFDAQTGETGTRTRVEAFVDMIRMRKAHRNKALGVRS